MATDNHLDLNDLHAMRVPGSQCDTAAIHLSRAGHRRANPPIRSCVEVQRTSGYECSTDMPAIACIRGTLFMLCVGPRPGFLVCMQVMKKLWSVGDRTAHGSNAFHRLVLTDRSSTALHPGGKVVQINANGSLVVRYRNGERATIRHPGRRARDVLAVGVAIQLAMGGRCSTTRVESVRDLGHPSPSHVAGLVRECDDAQRNVWILKPSNGQCGANIIITNRMSKIQVSGVQSVRDDISRLIC